MTTPKLVRLTNKSRIQLVNNVLRAIFEPRIDELKKRMKEAAQAIQMAHEREFFTYYADTKLRPYLQYSNGIVFCWREPRPTEKDPTATVSFAMAAPKLHTCSRDGECFMEMGVNCVSHAGVYDHNAGSQVHVTAHESRYLSVTAEELAVLQAFNQEKKDMQATFKVARDNLIASATAAKTVREFHDANPELKALTKMEEEVPPPIMLPTPAVSAAGLLKGMGLIPIK